MNERREFLKLVAAGPAGAMLLPLFAESGRGTAAAEIDSCSELLGRLPKNIIFTNECQGVWSRKQELHVPEVAAKRDGEKVALRVETKHVMLQSHYIVRHSVVNGHGEVLGARTFRWDDKPVSTYEVAVPKADGKADALYVLSFCNLHDLWLLETKLEV